MKMIIAFDVDGTLVDLEGDRRPEMVALVGLLAANPDCRVVVWSGGGAGYASMWGNRLGLVGVEYMAKNRALDPDVIFDDMADTKLGSKVLLVVSE